MLLQNWAPPVRNGRISDILSHRRPDKMPRRRGRAQKSPLGCSTYCGSQRSRDIFLWRGSLAACCTAAGALARS